VAAGGIFFFKDADRRTRLAEEQLARDGKTNNSAADDKMVVFFQ